MSWGLLVLFLITLAAVFIACKFTSYEITPLRKIMAAALFAILNMFPMPIPLVSFALPFIALWACLVKDWNDLADPSKTFGITIFGAIVGIVIVY